MKRIEVVCAAILHEGKVLIARRKDKAAGWFEFPGGKVEPGESLEAAVRREIREELGIEIHDLQFLAESTDVQDGTEIHLHCFTCQADVRPEAFAVHDCAVWTTPEHIYDYHFFEADRHLVRRLEEKWPDLPGHQSRK